MRGSEHANQLPTEFELAAAIEDAAGKAIAQLFAEHSSEHFYYSSLITSGEALPPVLTAWSKEALERELAKTGAPEELRSWLDEWSYGESPCFCYGEAYFGRVNQLFSKRPSMDGARMSMASEGESLFVILHSTWKFPLHSILRMTCVIIAPSPNAASSRRS